MINIDNKTENKIKPNIRNIGPIFQIVHIEY